MIKNITVPVTAIAKGPQQRFFGYYDRCPWSVDNRYLLTMEVPCINHFPENESAGIGIIDSHHDFKLTRLTETHAWNWQQGAMLQWIPSQPHQFIYNDRGKKDYGAVIVDITTGRKTLLPKAIAAISHSGNYALSINFARLYDTRKDYGYYGIPDPWHDNPHPPDDGIYVMNLNSGECNRILSLEQIAHYAPETTHVHAKHWFNHLSFNPDDSRFCFLHRFERPEIKSFGTRLFTADMDGSNIRCLWHNHVSHFDWLDSNHLLAWAVKKADSSTINKTKLFGLALLKKSGWLYKRIKALPYIRTHVYGGGFFLFTDEDGASTRLFPVGKGILTEDGHCSYAPDKAWILMDTYPDTHNYRHLLLYNQEKNSALDIGKFFSPPKLRGYLRCDLHARWNRDGKQICIDSAHEGSRQMYIVDISSIVQ
jgi:hypothetical protein